MKALSLTQPWASAVALGLKHWETRSWPTSFRGDVCIHASKGFPKWAKEFADEAARGYAMPELFPQNLPLGAIVCVAEITECRKAETAILELGEREQSWGDYAAGRYCFKLENVRMLTAPVSARGALSFWPVQWDEAKEVMRRVANPQMTKFR